MCSYVHGNNSMDEQWWSRHFMTHSIEAWQGQTFELVCMLHTDAIKKKLGISGIATDVASWRYVPVKGSGEKGAQVDMVISRADRVINLCEMKFAVGRYQMTKVYADYLRDRVELFRTKTNTPFFSGAWMVKHGKKFGGMMKIYYLCEKKHFNTDNDAWI